MEFFVLGKIRQLYLDTNYANMNELASLAFKNVKKETRTIHNYTSAKYNIIGFERQGKIF